MNSEPVFTRLEPFLRQRKLVQMKRTTRTTFTGPTTVFVKCDPHGSVRNRVPIDRNRQLIVRPQAQRPKLHRNFAGRPRILFVQEERQRISLLAVLASEHNTFVFDSATGRVNLPERIEQIVARFRVDRGVVRVTQLPHPGQRLGPAVRQSAIASRPAPPVVLIIVGGNPIRARCVIAAGQRTVIFERDVVGMINLNQRMNCRKYFAFRSPTKLDKTSDAHVEVGMEEVRWANVIEQSILDPGCDIKTQPLALGKRLRHTRREEQLLAATLFGSRIDQCAGAAGHLGQQVGVAGRFFGTKHVAPAKVIQLDSVHVVAIEHFLDERQHTRAYLLVLVVQPTRISCQPQLRVLDVELRLLRGSVPIVHPQADQELHATLATPIEQDRHLVGARGMQLVEAG